MSNMYSEEVIEEVRSRNDIVDVISEYVSLRKTGTSYKARCPFHNEKTPSFSVSPDKQIYHCFGCGVGGNVINFIMSIENLSFVDALKSLASRGGMILPEKNEKVDKERYRKKQIQYEIHTEAARFFYQNLKNNEVALRYLNSRNIHPKTMVKFGLGYASDNWEDLYRHLLSKNYKKEDIALSGLVLPRKNQNNEFYDRFRNRLMFPVFDLTNHVIAFGGRILDKQLPKYLNSPETEIFSKGNHLYGLNIAKKNIVDGQIIIVEGYMDVISLYQYGIKNTVASLGTALTKQQAQLLSRYAEEIIIIYDGDEAGQKATLRALDTLAYTQSKVKIVQLPGEMDPDEYIKKHKVEGFMHQTKKALSSIEYKILLAKKKHDINTTEGKIDFTKEVAKILKNIKSEIEIDIYIKKISKEVGINESAIKSEVFHNKKASSPRPKNKIGNIRNTMQYNGNQYKEVVKTKERKSAVILAEEHLLNIIAQDLGLFQVFKKHMNWKDFTDEVHREIAKIIYEKMENKEFVTPAQLLDIFKTQEDSSRISQIFARELNREFMDKNILEYINTIRIYKLQNKIDNLNNRLKDSSAQTNTETSNEIYIEIVKLKKQIEELKGT